MTVWYSRSASQNPGTGVRWSFNRYYNYHGSGGANYRSVAQNTWFQTDIDQEEMGIPEGFELGYVGVRATGWTSHSAVAQVEVYAPCDGIVSEVTVEVGDTVESKDLLVRVKPAK